MAIDLVFASMTYSFSALGGRKQLNQSALPKRATDSIT